MTSTVDRPALPGQNTAARRLVVRRLPEFEPEPEPAPKPEQSTPSPATASDPAPRMQAHAQQVLRLVIEVLDGRRPAAQLAGLLSGPVRQYVVTRIGRLDEPGHRHGAGWSRRADRRGEPGIRGHAGGPRLHVSRVCQPCPGIAEVSAVWRHRGRCRALAARFELHASDPYQVELAPNETGIPRWWCTALRLG